MILDGKKLKLNKTAVKGAKVLHKVPDYLNEDAMAQIAGNKKTHLIEFESLSKYKKFMQMHTDYTKGHARNSMLEREWAGTKTWDGFLDVLDDGDADVIKKIKVETNAQVAELSKKYEENLINYRFDVVGQFFDVGLVLSGVPECWLEPEVTVEEKVQVDLVINGAFSGTFDKKEIIKASARILAMTKILEEHGVQVSIKIVSSNIDYNDGYDESMFCTTFVKDYDEPLNYKKCSALISPTYHRRGMFKLMELCQEGQVNGGYGSPRPFDGVIQLNDGKMLDKLERKLFTKEK